LTLIKKDAIGDAYVVTYVIQYVNEKCSCETVDILSCVSLSLLILIIKAKKMHYFWTSFWKELYMFQTDILSETFRVLSKMKLRN